MVRLKDTQRFPEKEFLLDTCPSLIWSENVSEVNVMSSTLSLAGLQR